MKQLIDRIGNYSYYVLTDYEIFLYKYMETLTYISSIEVETILVNNILSIKGSNILVNSVLIYFEELGKSSEYKIWLRKYKLNDICSKLVK